MQTRPILSLVLVLSAAAAAVAQEPMAIAQNLDRKLTRLVYFSGDAPPAQFSIEYGQPPWKDEYEPMIDALKGNRARFGQDFWTTLESNVDLQIGGTAVAAGYYYLALGRTKSGDWRLVLFDPAAVRARRADAFMSEQMGADPAVEVPLTYAKASGEPAQKLTVELAKHGKIGNAKLSIRWGAHELAAPIVADLKAPAKAPAEANERGAKKGRGK